MEPRITPVAAPLRGCLLAVIGMAAVLVVLPETPLAQSPMPLAPLGGIGRLSGDDVSVTGARITVTAAHEVPDEFHLIFSADRMMRKVLVVWRRGQEIGVEFDGELRNLMQDPDPRLRQFRFI